MLKYNSLANAARIYRKKPILIEAFELTREMVESHVFDNTPLPASLLLGSAGYHKGDRRLDYFRIYIDTLEGRMEASIGDWIIKGVKGEFYPCKPDIFAATYDLVG